MRKVPPLATKKIEAAFDNLFDCIEESWVDQHGHPAARGVWRRWRWQGASPCNRYTSVSGVTRHRGGASGEEPAPPARKCEIEVVGQDSNPDRKKGSQDWNPDPQPKLTGPRTFSPLA